MPLPWPELLLLGAAVSLGSPLAAQQGPELGVQIVGTASDPELAVAAVYAGLRTSARTRFSASAGAGASGGDPAFRGELLGHFLLSPDRGKGAGFYLAGGVAGVAGAVDRGYLVLTAGLEGGPGADTGWALEIGVGGGARVALGYRWRWLRAGRRG